MRIDSAIAIVGAVCCLAACDRLPFTPAGKAREAVISGLIDPVSGRYKKLYDNATATCGTIDGKNRMGAYTGGSPFIYEKATGEVTTYSGPPDFSDYRMWSAQTGSPQTETYQKMERGCGFPQQWKVECEPTSAAALPVNEEFCELWRKKDLVALSGHQ